MGSRTFCPRRSIIQLEAHVRCFASSSYRTIYHVKVTAFKSSHVLVRDNIDLDVHERDEKCRFGEYNMS